MKLITLTSDFGTRDGYPSVMKGVILTICPEAQIVDITHEITPQQVLEGALTLARSIPYFPAGTVHIAVVDPGVGTARRPLAAQLGSQYFVLPDNGLLSAILVQAEEQNQPIEIVHLNQVQFWLPQISNVFHGRDIFAPVGAHLANGVMLSALGSPIHDPQRLKLPEAEPISGGWLGTIIHVDHFGNLATSLKGTHVLGWQTLKVQLANQILQIPLKQTFGDGKPGELIALVDSSGYLALCMVNGNASSKLKVNVGEPVEILRQS